MAMLYTAMSKDRETGQLETSLHTATHDPAPALDQVQEELGPDKQLLFLARGQVDTHHR